MLALSFTAFDPEATSGQFHNHPKPVGAEALAAIRADSEKGSQRVPRSHSADISNLPKVHSA
jgi:hypothetical protein